MAENIIRRICLPWLSFLYVQEHMCVGFQLNQASQKTLSYWGTFHISRERYRNISLYPDVRPQKYHIFTSPDMRAVPLRLDGQLQIRANNKELTGHASLLSSTKAASNKAQ